jgi:hypothetical protein
LFNLQSKKKLAQLLDIPLKSLERLRDGSSLYNVFSKKRSGKKDRIIEEPIGIRFKAHKRLFGLLQRIETPGYLISGKRGFSYLDNAKCHVDNFEFLQLDIERFYPTSKKEFIFRFFRHKLQMSEDVAWLVTDIVRFQDHIPTGSPISQVLAFWAYENTFNKLAAIAVSNGYTFTLYVDDMTFSSTNAITPNFHLRIGAQLRLVGLKLKRNKIRYRTKNQFKIVTGCVISPDRHLYVPNKLRKNIVDALVAIDESEMDESILKSLQGRIVAAQSIEKDIFALSGNKVKKRFALIHDV